MGRTFIALIGCLSVSGLPLPVVAHVPDPDAAKVFAAHCIRRPQLQRLSNGMRPLPVLCQMEDGSAGWPGDFPPPHYQLPNDYSERRTAATSSLPSVTEAPPSSTPPRSSTVRK